MKKYLIPSIFNPRSIKFNDIMRLEEKIALGIINTMEWTCKGFYSGLVLGIRDVFIDYLDPDAIQISPNLDTLTWCVEHGERIIKIAVPPAIIAGGIGFSFGVALGVSRIVKDLFNEKLDKL